jgi:hypothetical protein
VIIPFLQGENRQIFPFLQGKTGSKTTFILEKPFIPLASTCFCGFFLPYLAADERERKRPNFAG